MDPARMGYDGTRLKRDMLELVPTLPEEVRVVPLRLRPTTPQHHHRFDSHTNFGTARILSARAGMSRGQHDS